MASVCFYFQMHQPMRLRRFSIFEMQQDYFDQQANRTILNKVSDKSYIPGMQLLIELIKRYKDRFHFSISITGLLIDQWRQWRPEVLDLFTQLIATGQVELLNETYYHSLAFLYSPTEFQCQIDLHTALMKELFGITPTIFRNTELTYNNAMAAYLAQQGKHQGILAEGADRLLGERKPNHIYQSNSQPPIALALKHYQLSDDVAFRFSNRQWAEWPLRAETFADWIHRTNEEGPICNLFMDFETFGEHQWADTGIFDFLRALPGHVFKRGDDFATISQAIAAHQPVGTYDVPEMISWADTERDLSAWLGNAMQSSAHQELFKLEQPIKQSGDQDLIRDWRWLTTSDHFYYMCTKYFEDGQVHKYFSPYESPYDSYINFMNVLDNLRSRLGM